MDLFLQDNLTLIFLGAGTSEPDRDPPNRSARVTYGDNTEQVRFPPHSASFSPQKCLEKALKLHLIERRTSR